MQRKLQLDFLEEEEKEQQEKNNYLDSDFTQLLDNQLKFIKEDLMINQKGIQLHQKMFPFTIKNQIETERLLGMGSTAKVYLVHFKEQPEKKLAMKSISVFEKQNRSQLLNDLKNYFQLNNECPFLLDFYGGYFDQGTVKIFLEYMDRGSLRQLINEHKEKKQRISERVVKFVMERIFHGLSYMNLVN